MIQSSLEQPFPPRRFIMPPRGLLRRIPFLGISNPTNLGSATTTTSTDTSLTITSTAPIAAGNLVGVVMYIYATAPAISSVSDGTNSYAKASPTTSYANFNLATYFIANAAAVASSASIKITFASAIGSFNYVIANAFQCAGVGNNDTGSGNAVGLGANTNPSVTSNALAQNSELMIGWQASFGGASSGLTYNEAAGWTNLTTAESATQIGGFDFVYSSLSYKIVSSTAAVTWNPTYSSAPADGVNVMITGFEGNSSVVWWENQGTDVGRRSMRATAGTPQ